MEVTEGRVVLINADRAVSCHRWLSPRDQAAFTISTGVGESTYSVEADAASPRLLGTPFAADLDCGQCYAVLPGGQVLPRYTSGRLTCLGLQPLCDLCMWEHNHSRHGVCASLLIVPAVDSG